MAIDDFCKQRTVTWTNGGEGLGHEILITKNDASTVTIYCVAEKTNRTGTYREAVGADPERIEVDGSWITFKSPTQICYAPARALQPCVHSDIITGSWTADDHPIDDGTA